jgi:diguanylate cyclase (GGDEF)-like protein/PAS domain S-box-containing protein
MPHDILLIQDDSADAKRVQEALAHSSVAPFRVDWVRRCAEGLNRLAAGEKPGGGGIAAILVDLCLPDCQGIEALNLLLREAPHIPILVLSTPQEEEIAKLAVQRGAQDYLLKTRVDSYWLPKALGSMFERAAIAEALFDEKERAQVMLNSIGDAVISSDTSGIVTYLNLSAETMTGWARLEAEGHPLEKVLRIIDATTRESVTNPMMLAIRNNKIAHLTPNCLLVRRDGVEAAIEDSVAPIHDRRGRVTGAVMVFHDVSTTRALSLRMSYLAQHDSLTDLPNRALLNDRLTQGIALAHRHRQQLAVLFLDVDRFKRVNDSLGHDVGDRLLQSVAQRLLACVRTSDTVSRQGGDEFVILLSDVTRARDAAVIAEKILVALSPPHHIDRHILHLTASIGIVLCPDDGTDTQTLLKHADFAMYHAKDRGRNTYQFFKPDMNERALERQSLENGLRHALQRQEFLLHFQPKINLRTEAIVGVEALIRWHHPRHGLVPPAQFVPIAEESGLIVPIGKWVLREACRQARAWQVAGLPLLSIAINISSVELRDAGFVAGVRAILLETGLAPNHLELELTETFLVQDSQSTATVLQSLKETGVQLALDDFGTGFSSLSHLKRFPVDTLKIDQSFVRKLTTDPGDAGIVSAVISMGRSLHMRVVAEGVETAEQLEFLRRYRCPEGQGYYFSHPVAAEEFVHLLERGVAPPRPAPERMSRKPARTRMGINASGVPPKTSLRRAPRD